MGLYALHRRSPLAIRERSPLFSMRRLRGIRTDFRYLFWNFREIARAVHKAGGAACLKWPNSV
eukprot:1453244-Pyramimonas_sp.AAC.1